MLRVYDMNDVLSLTKSKWMIPEPDFIYQQCYSHRNDKHNGNDSNNEFTESQTESKSNQDGLPSENQSQDGPCHYAFSKIVNISRDEACDVTKQSSRDVSLVILPGIAFDSNKNRMGYGRGYYDRYLEKLIMARADACENDPKLQLEKVTLVGIGLNVQLVDNVPVGSHDLPLDMVIIDDQILE